MKIVGIIAIIASIVIIAGIIVLARYGLFASVKISEQTAGPYTLVYTKHIGDYKNVAPVMDSLYSDLKDNYGMEPPKGFGLYYDNPRDVDKEELRSIVGCILDDGGDGNLVKVQERYSIGEYPESKSVVVEFPYKGSMSIMVGMMRVYPKLNKYFAENDYSQTPIMEIYDQQNAKIQYVASVNLSQEIFQSFLE